MFYHDPVMVSECISGLECKPDGIYVDVTFGGGGHSRAILQQLGPKGRLVAFDQDEDAIRNAINDERLILIRDNFKNMNLHLSQRGLIPVNGILADLGVSSYQFDEAERGFSIRFDHDFVGREALEKISKAPARTKVTLELHTEDVMKAIGSQFESGNRAKFMEFPSAVYSTWPYDKVLNKEGKTIGVSTWVGYSSNEGKMLTLAILDNAYTQPGEQVTFVWGENPVTSKTTVEPHTQMSIRATVCPVPYATVAREAYRTT